MRSLGEIYLGLGMLGVFLLFLLWLGALGTGVEAVHDSGATLSAVGYLLSDEGPHPLHIAICLAVAVGIVVDTEPSVRGLTGVADSLRVFLACIGACFLGLAGLTATLIATDFRHLPYDVLKAPDAALRPYHLFALAFVIGAGWLVLYLWRRKAACLGAFLFTPMCVAAIVAVVYPGEFAHGVLGMALPAAYPSIQTLGIPFAILIAAWWVLQWLWRWLAELLTSDDGGVTVALAVAGVWAWVVLAAVGHVLIWSWWNTACLCISDAQLARRRFSAETVLAFACVWGGIVVVQKTRYKRRRREEAAQNSISAVTG